MGGSGMIAIERGKDLDDTVLHKGIMTGPTSSLTCMTQTGEMIWTKPQSVHSSPNMIQQLKVWPDRPTLFVATFTPEQDGLPCLIDADTGKERWRMKGSKQTPGRPIQVDSLDLDADGNPEVIYVAVQSADGSNPQGRQKDAATIYCINGDNGACSLGARNSFQESPRPVCPRCRTPRHGLRIKAPHSRH